MILSGGWQGRERNGKAGADNPIQGTIKPRGRGGGNIQFCLRPWNPG
jgi:hypothetical protein